MQQGDSLRNQLAKKLREIHVDIMATEIPPNIARLLGEPPDRPPTRGAPGQRVAPVYVERADEAEAAEQQVA
jgi:hypothetical protein